MGVALLDALVGISAARVLSDSCRRHDVGCLPKLRASQIDCVFFATDQVVGDGENGREVVGWHQHDRLWPARLGELVGPIEP